jgi:uncharacterized protein (DUF2147 family)
MRFEKGLLAITSITALLMAAPQALAASSPTGIWLNDTGRGAIEVKPCGDGVCGHVVWLRDASDTKGCGRQIIGDAKPIGSGMWDNGWIYSPEKKKKYDVELKPLADGNLRVKGYAGSKFFSKTMVWTPAPADLKRCGGQVLATAEPAPVPVAAPQVIPPAPAPVAAPAPAPVAEVKDEPKPAPVATVPPVAQPAPDTNTTPVPPAASEPDVATENEAENAGKDSVDIAGILDKLKDFEKETGYGLKKTSDGSCRLKVPFATIKIKCNDIE